MPMTKQILGKPTSQRFSHVTSIRDREHVQADAPTKALQNLTSSVRPMNWVGGQRFSILQLGSCFLCQRKKTSELQSTQQNNYLRRYSKVAFSADGASVQNLYHVVMWIITFVPSFVPYFVREGNFLIKPHIPLLDFLKIKRPCFPPRRSRSADLGVAQLTDWPAKIFRKAKGLITYKHHALTNWASGRQDQNLWWNNRIYSLKFSHSCTAMLTMFLPPFPRVTMAPLTPLRGVIPLLHGGGKLQTPIPTLTLGGTLKSQRGVGQVAPRHPDQHRKNHLDEVSVKAGRVFFWIFGFLAKKATGVNTYIIMRGISCARREFKFPIYAY